MVESNRGHHLNVVPYLGKNLIWGLLYCIVFFCIVEPGALPGSDFIDSRESKGIASPDLF